MSMWQFFSAMEGYRKAHSPDAAGELSAAESDNLWAMVQRKQGLH